MFFIGVKGRGYPFYYGADYAFHEKASQVFDLRTSIFIPILPLERVSISLFLLTQTVTLPFALFLRPAIFSVHVKIRFLQLID
jgi:hypothetical protein